MTERIETASTEVAVIVLTVDQRETTLRCLESLSRVAEPDHCVLVWDNGSKDGTAEAVRAKFPEVRVHRHPQNLGVASGRNAAAQKMIEDFQPRYLLFLDNDTAVTPGFLKNLVEAISTNPRLGLATPKIRNLSDGRILYGAGGCRTRFWIGDTSHIGYGEVDRGQYDTAKSCLPSGGCLLVRTAAFRELEGFDAAFDPYGPEDLDFGLRAVKLGYETLYVPQSVISHAARPGRSFDGGAYSQLFAATRARHWLRFLHRHASTTQKLAFYLVGGPYLLVKVAVREARRGNLLSAMRGLFQGIVASLRSSSSAEANR